MSCSSFKLGCAAIAVALISGGLPAEPGASPLSFNYNTKFPALGSAEMSSLLDLADSLAYAWKGGEGRTLWRHVDSGRCGLVYREQAQGRSRLGPAYATLTADPSPNGVGFQEKVWRQLRADAPRWLRAARAEPSLMSVSLSDERMISQIPVGGQKSSVTTRHYCMHGEHPFMQDLLVVSILTDRDWNDPIFAPWAEADVAVMTSADTLAGQEAQAIGPWTSDKELKRAAKQISRQEREKGKRGVVSRLFGSRILGAGLKDLRWQMAAVEEFRRQQGMDCSSPWPATLDSLVGTPPACPGADRAVLRLVFQRLRSTSSSWQLAMVFPSRRQVAGLQGFCMEPGFGDWREDYRLWHEKGMAWVNKSEKGGLLPAGQGRW